MDHKKGRRLRRQSHATWFPCRFKWDLISSMRVWMDSCSDVPLSERREENVVEYQSFPSGQLKRRSSESYKTGIGGGERGKEGGQLLFASAQGPRCTRKMRCLRSDGSILSGALIWDLRCPALNADWWAGPREAPAWKILTKTSRALRDIRDLSLSTKVRDQMCNSTHNPCKTHAHAQHTQLNRTRSVRIKPWRDGS